MRAVEARRGRRRIGQALAALATVGAMTFGVAGPAYADRSGTYRNGDVEVQWWAGSTYTTIRSWYASEAPRAGICRYYSGAPHYYYGPPASYTGAYSRVSSTAGSHCGNFFTAFGTRIWV